MARSRIGVGYSLRATNGCASPIKIGGIVLRRKEAARFFVLPEGEGWSAGTGGPPRARKQIGRRGGTGVGFPGCLAAIVWIVDIFDGIQGIAPFVNLLAAVIVFVTGKFAQGVGDTGDTSG